MNSYIRPPDLNNSYSISADWLEILCLVRPLGTSSDTDITAPHDILDDHAAIFDSDSIAEDLDLNITDSPRDRALDALFDEIERRNRDLGEAYPFSARISPRHLHLRRANESIDEPLEYGRHVYRACLLMSAIRSGLIDIQKAGLAVDPIVGNLFQICATLAAAGYLSGDAYWFGAPRPDKTSLLNAVKKLSHLLNSGEPREHRPEGETKYAKDAGVDVVAWRAHSDGWPGQLIMYCQCASGMNWEAKPVTGKVQRLEGYYWRSPSTHWLPALMLPFPLYMGKENAHALHSETDIKGFYRQIESEMGLIFDRNRIVLGVIDALRDLSPSARQAADHLVQIVEWCNDTTRSIGGHL